MIDSTQKMKRGASALPGQGELFASRYLVHEQAGRGGFAKILRATDQATGAEVAVKVLVPQMPAPNYYSDELVSRFQREALVLREVDSPFVVSMLDFGRHDGLLYMVFEYVDGQTISAMLKNGPIEYQVVEHILPQLLDALHKVHKVGLLHRDLKPSNIMVYDHAGDPHHVKLLDFGIAKSYAPTLTNAVIPDVTAKGQVVGTPRYMSPEQILGEPCSPACDLYSLACVVVEMVSGERLVPGDDPVWVVRRHLDPSPLVIPTGLPLSPMLRSALTSMLNKDPADRPQSAMEVTEALETTLVNSRHPFLAQQVFDESPTQKDSLADTRPFRKGDITSEKPGVPPALDWAGERPTSEVVLPNESTAPTVPSFGAKLAPTRTESVTAPAVVAALASPTPATTAAAAVAVVAALVNRSVDLTSTATELTVQFPVQATSTSYAAIGVASAVCVVSFAFLPWWTTPAATALLLFVVFRAFARPRLWLGPVGWRCDDQLGPLAIKRAGALQALVGLAVRPLAQGLSEVVMMKTAGELFLARLPTDEALWLADEVNTWVAGHR